jgi:hypothetical protein
MSQSTPAGWYPAPHANNQLRYWDGAAWHDTVPPPVIEPPTAYPPNTSTGGTRSTVPQGLAIAAFAVGLVAFFTGLIPWFGLLMAIAAVVLAVFALRRGQSRGFSVVGLISGGCALITGLIVAVVFSVGVGSSTLASGNGGESGTSVTAPTATPAPTPVAVDTTPAPAQPESDQAAPPPADLGSVSHPYPQPYVARGLLGGEKYSLSGAVVDPNATALVHEWNQFNTEAPAGFKYVVVQLTMTGIDPDGVEPSLAEWDLYLATSEGNRYSSEIVAMGEGMPSMNDGPTLYPGSSFTGYAAYVVPEAAQSFLLYDNGNYVAV